MNPKAEALRAVAKAFKLAHKLHIKQFTWAQLAKAMSLAADKLEGK